MGQKGTLQFKDVDEVVSELNAAKFFIIVDA